MTITLDNLTDADHAGNFTATDAFAIAAATHGILIVVIPALSANGVASVTGVGSITYNSVALTQLTSDVQAFGEANENLAVWYLLDPPSGTHNIVTSLNGTPSGRPNGWHMIAVSYTATGVLSLSGSTNSHQSTATAVSVTVASSATSLVIGAAYSIGTSSTNLTSAGGQTNREGNGVSFDSGIGEFSSARVDEKAGGTSVTLSWTATSPQHSFWSGFSIDEVQAAVNPTFQMGSSG